MSGTASWYWGDDGNEFVPYLEQHSCILEEAYREKKQRMDAKLTIGSHTYRVRNLAMVPSYIKKVFESHDPAARRDVWIQQRIGEASLWREVQRVGGADGSGGAGHDEAATEPSQSAPPSESGTPDNLVGKEVVIHGIKKRTELNGKRAHVTEIGKGDNAGRYLVRIIDGGEGKKRLALRLDNLMRVDTDEQEDGNVTDEYGGSGEDDDHGEAEAQQPRDEQPVAEEESHAQKAAMDEDDDGTEAGDETENDEPQDRSEGGAPVPPPPDAAAHEPGMEAEEGGASAATEAGEESDGYEARPASDPPSTIRHRAAAHSTPRAAHPPPLTWAVCTTDISACDDAQAQLRRLLEERPPDVDQDDIDWVLQKTPAECIGALEGVNEQIEVEEAKEDDKKDLGELTRLKYFARVCELRATASRRESVIVD